MEGPETLDDIRVASLLPSCGPDIKLKSSGLAASALARLNRLTSSVCLLLSKLCRLPPPPPLSQNTLGLLGPAPGLKGDPVRIGAEVA